jgi:drug/metabolite transporter (DMT)-like permease
VDQPSTKTLHSIAGIELGIWSGLGYLAQSEALAFTDASRASLLSTFTVLLVPVLVGLTGQKIRPIVWVCALAALGGTSLLEQSGSPPNIGDLAGLISAGFFAVQVCVCVCVYISHKSSSGCPN